MDKEKVIRLIDTLIFEAQDEQTWKVEALRCLKKELLKKQNAVVHCKDCKNNNQCSIQFKFADTDDPENWFCAYGKRK